MTDRDKAAFLYGISFTVEKLKTTEATGADSGNSLFAEANRALQYGPKLLNIEVLAEIEKALESGGFSWPPAGG